MHNNNNNNRTCDLVLMSLFVWITVLQDDISGINLFTGISHADGIKLIYICNITGPSVRSSGYETKSLAQTPPFSVT